MKASKNMTKIIAFKTLSNVGGIGIHENSENFVNDNDTIEVGLYTDKLLSLHCLKLYCNNKGYYFILGRRHYLHDFMRTE